MREEARGVGMGQGGGGNSGIELLDLGVKRLEQLETVVAALRGIGRQEQRLQLGQPGAPQQLGAARQALIEIACSPFLSMVWIRTRRRRWVSSARRSRVAGSGTQTVGNRSCRSRSRRCRASR
jgi:hypothetical protein